MTSSLQFDVHATSAAARAGLLRTPHGEVPTPAFMPVATQGSVKALAPYDVDEVGTHILLANAYHLYLRPGVDVVRELGGLHSFMGWPGPILTDSGGFQAFSLGTLKKVTDEGVLFKSHIDGSQHLFTPEAAVAHQQALGADIIMCLDQCIANSEGEEAVHLAMLRTHRWAAKCREAHVDNSQQALFGIVQGGVYPNLREESVRAITSLEFDGYAIGGLAVGEPKAVMYQLTSQVADLLPHQKPRYLMGVGSPEDLVECVARGVDIFDCALPTRVARNGALFTHTGRVDITAAKFRQMTSPVEEDCDCSTCRSYSTAYLHHLFRAGELLGLRLASIHNLRFVLRLMEEMRHAILDGTFPLYRERFLAEYKPTDEAARLSQKQRWIKQRGQ